MKKIGVLALQGAFIEHISLLQELGAEAFPVRLPSQLDGIDGLIMPGGESTTIGKLLVAYDFEHKLRGMAREGFPIYGTCAGMILLAKQVEGRVQPILGVMDLTVRRNAFGRQVDSFEVDLPIPALGEAPFHAIFIRAPRIGSIGSEVACFAALPDGEIVGARQGNLLVTAFHPELTTDTRLHEYFLGMT